MGDVLNFFMTTQYVTQNRLRALKYDPNAVPKPQDPTVQQRNATLKQLFDVFDFHIRLDLTNDEVFAYLKDIGKLGLTTNNYQPQHLNSG